MSTEEQDTKAKSPEWYDESKLRRIRFAPGETGWAIDMGNGLYRLANSPIMSMVEEIIPEGGKRTHPHWGDLVRIRGGSKPETYLEIVEHYVPEEEVADGVTSRTVMLPPIVGMSSLVGIGSSEYPLKFGNYCSIASGPYLVNMWAENLEEWSKRHPEVKEIEITVVSHGDRAELGYVSDDRLSGWCNAGMCVTGYGWPTAAMCRFICDRLGVPVGDWLCGCELPTESPSIGERWNQSAEGASGHEFNCRLCKRVWPKIKESK